MYNSNINPRFAACNAGDKLKKTKTLALVLTLIFSLLLSACSKEPERLEGDNTLPSASIPQETEDLFEEEEETETTTIPTEETSETTKRTAISTEAPELATTTGTTSPENTAPITPGELSSHTTVQTQVPDTETEIVTSKIVVSELPVTKPKKTEPAITETTASKVSPVKTAITRPYSYYSMSDIQKYAYDTLYKGIITFEEEIEFSSDSKVSINDLYYVYQTMLNDQTDLFYINNTIQYYANTSTKNVVKVLIEYTISRQEAEKKLKAADAAADSIIAEINDSMSEYDIVKLFHDRVITATDYSLTSADGSNIYGTLVGKSALCQGYAKTFTYLCNKAGIQSLLVTGEADSEPHMWNMVKVDGSWYHIDLTWDDANRAQDAEFIRYDYLNVPDSVINRSRTIYSQEYSYPKASSLKANYYVVSGYTAASYKEAESLLTNMIVNSSKTKNRYVQFICTSKESYEEIKTKLFDKYSGTALNILDSANQLCTNKINRDTLTYNTNDDTYTIKLFLEYLD